VQDKIYILVGLKERDHLEGQGIDGRMGSEGILGRLAGGMWGGFNWLRIGTNWSVGWIKMAQDTNQWWALVNVVMNLQILAPRN
jgi:hypothetical protein